MANFFVALFSLIFLVLLHEFSHFLAAKKTKVKVDEFGIGYPPRIVSKKIGETVYSLNLIPLGAFVRINDFPTQPLSKRIKISLAGVFSFWIISAIIFSSLFIVGNRVSVSDEEDKNLISPKVQITAIAKNSPAEISGLRVGDAILEIQILEFETKKVDKVREVQEIVKKNLGKEITLIVERGKEIFKVKITPRISPPEGEGPMGVVLTRTAIKKYPIEKAIFYGTKQTLDLTLAIIKGYYFALKNLFLGKETGVEMMGPVGIFALILEVTELGFIYFLNFLSQISIYLAIFNLLPIPALDGGKVLFLVLEAIRKKPISQKTEEKIAAFFFAILILVAILVTIKDIAKILKL